MKKEMVPLFILGIISAVFCDCPVEQIHSIGYCSYRIECTETIKIVGLDRSCTGSINYDVKLEVTLHNASVHVTADEDNDEDSLTTITTLKIFANWPETNLLFLNTMYNLKHLYLSNDNIKIIHGSPFRNLMYLEVLDLSHNSISDIEELFRFDIDRLRMFKLSLAYNLIDEVTPDTFQELTSLVELDLSYNFITELSEESFSNLTNLQILKLNNNKIKNLNGAMNNLTHLSHLYLDHNEIQYIDMQSLKTINHLVTFDISKNQIQDLNPTFLLRHWDHIQNHSYCKIAISGNYINSLRNSTLYLFDDPLDKSKRNIKPTMEIFTELDFSKNLITHIEYNAFQSIGQIISLDLSSNKLFTFDVNSKDLVFVKYLNLSSNLLTKLSYDSFAFMNNLQNLDLSHNEVYYFPDQSLRNNNKIKYINVTYNDISELYSLRITFHPEGGILDLSNNGLFALSIPVNEAIFLRELILNSNNITDAFLIRLTDQRSLTKLEMINNFIQELDDNSLHLPNSLVYLDLSYNKIERIGPSAFHRVSHLKTLKLSHNNLKNIEFGIFRGLTGLLNLDLSFNQIELLDSKVFMDLKLLRVLSLRYNGLVYLDSDSWLSHKYNLTVYIDGNGLSCEWLAKTLNDFNNGYSKMYPTVLERSITGHSIGNIPCKQETSNIIQSNSHCVMDERLLITTQKILEAIQEQTNYVKKSLWQLYLQKAEKEEAANEI